LLVMVRVKICGITNEEDALAAVRLGADALGFIFAPSPRQVSPESARRIIDLLPPFVQIVGVFVDETLDNIRRMIDRCGLDLFQLQGDEPPGFCRELMPRTIKSFRIRDASSLASMGRYRGAVKALHLDTFRKGTKGGTGETFNWELAVAAGRLGMPVILAGGLGPSNIEEAMEQVAPFALDVNSGIEERPGKKNLALMEELMKKVKGRNGEADER